MSTTVNEPSNIRTFAEFLEYLGGISPERIRWQPPPGTATVEDVVRVEERENRLCELVDGVLVEKTMGYLESRIAVKLITALDAFVESENLGVVTGADGMMRFLDDQVRIPDMAFAGWNRFPNGELTDEAVPEIVPDLVAEVLSKGNTAAEMERKLLEYFRAGVQLVWYVDPKTKSVTVFTSPSRRKVIPTSGTLDGGKVLPGFSFPVANLFSKPKPIEKKRK